MLNKKVLSKINLGSYKKPNPYSKDIIYDPKGQWKYPGQNTRIPGEDITMQGVPYPVYAQPNIGQPQMMYPDQNYQFPGADYVDEFPQMKKGGRTKGLISMPKPSKKGLMSKKYSRSLDATNKLFTENYLFAKPKSRKNKVFDPNSKYYAEGGEYIDAELTSEEIEEYRRGGFIVEEIDTFQNGGVYTVKGSKGNYKKVNGKWQVDWNKSGKYQPLSKGDVKARTVVLDKMAKPLYDKDYDEMVAYKNLSTKDKINKFKPKKELTKEELKNISNRLGRDYKPEDTKLQSVDMVYPEKYIIGPGGGLLNQGLKTGVGAIEKLAATKIPGLFGTTVGQVAGAGFAADALVNQFPGAISDIGKGEYEDAAEKALYGTLGLAGSGIGKGVVSGAKDLSKFLGTDSGVLSNTYKINPWAFKANPKAYYHRSPNLENIVNRETGTLQGFGNSKAGIEFSKDAGPGGTGNLAIRGDGSVSRINLKKPANSQLYFSKGVPLDGGRYNKVLNKKTGKLIDGQGYEGPYMVEVEGVPMGASTKGRAPGADVTNIGGYAVPRRPISLDEAKFYKEHWLKGYKEVPKQLPGSSNVVSSVDDVVKQPWQMEELPGLHLQSTMEGEAISKIVDKTGKINTEQALAIIAKESGGADKVALIKQGLGENIPKKIDFNEFRKTVQDQLIPLERQFVDYASDYGINRLGYKEPEFITRNVNGKTINELTSDVIENQTLVLSNKGKFGRGSSAHGNPDETLGHAHYLIDKESPNVLTVTQVQSDAFQGTHRSMPKNIDDATEKLNRTKAYADDASDLMGDEKEKFKSVFDIANKELQLDKATIENFTQKSLLDKNHQERYLQELVDYAGKRGDVNKVRVPTSETAAKVQGYKQRVQTGDNTPGFAKLQEEISIATRQGNQEKVNELMKVHDEMLNTPYKSYNSEHQTILKKYSEQPKLIKKLFGQDAKIVTDSKGNTWYEFNIPEKFKKGKGEIKAFSTIGTGVLGLGLGATQYKQGGTTNDYVDAELTPEEIKDLIAQGYVIEELN